MISVVLYGRNDQHGYNLHKRAALGLNCIAELLESDDDEIIFVDYNTPNDLPTFPEAIADTLTPQLMRRLRIIRVRPDYHKQFDGRTRLVALEPQSRNIAVRRANPRNRWILSTNPDMIFVLRNGMRSLTEVASRLADGFYHLPRFELPENLWELLDRRAPGETIGTLRDWGRRFHLNEIVYGGFDNVYEAPGDFQLFLKQDFEAIAGFDESMLLGWHADTNVARRMKLFRGEVKSAVEYVFGYHCGHTRQATALHSHARTENSLDTYVREVREAVCHAQMDGWGAPDWQFEERRVTENTRARTTSALAKVLTAQGPETSEVALHVETYCLTSYSSDHVLPHLYNLVGELPRGRCFLLYGNDGRLFASLASLLGEADLAPQIVLPSEMESSIARAVAQAGAPVQSLSLAEAIAAADVFILQYPGADVTPPERRRELQWRCLQAFEQIAEAERLRPLSERRLLIVVNGVHTRLQDHLWANMSYTAIPFTARLRHGYVNDAPSDPEAPLPDTREMAEVRVLLGRSYPLTPVELNLFREVFSSANGDGLNVAGWERLAIEIEALTRESRVAEALFDLPAEVRQAAHRHASAAITAAAQRCIVAPEHVGPRVGVPTRLCAPPDWEDEAWRKSACRLFAGWHAYALPARGRWHWERLSLLHTLLHATHAHARPRILVVSNWPEPMGAYAAYHGYRVVQASLQELETGEPSEVDHAAGLDIWNLILPGDARALIDPTTRTAVWGEPYDAILILGCLFSGLDSGRLDRLAERLHDICAPDALIAASVLVHLNDGAGGGALAFREWQEIFESHGAFGRLGCRPAGAMDGRIPLQTAVRFALEDTPTPVPGLSFGWGSGFVTAGTAVGRLGFAASDIVPASTALAPAQLSTLLDVAHMLQGRTAYARVIPGYRRSILPLVKVSGARAGDDPDIAFSHTPWAAIGIEASTLTRFVLRFEMSGANPQNVQAAAFVGEDGRTTIGSVSSGGDAIEVRFDAAAPLGRGIAISLVEDTMQIKNLTIE